STIQRNSGLTAYGKAIISKKRLAYLRRPLALPLWTKTRPLLQQNPRKPRNRPALNRGLKQLHLPEKQNPLRTPKRIRIVQAKRPPVSSLDLNRDRPRVPKKTMQKITL